MIKVSLNERHPAHGACRWAGPGGESGVGRPASLLRQDLVAGFADVTFTAPTGQTTLLRLSIVAERVSGTWSISLYHAAAPAVTAP